MFTNLAGAVVDAVASIGVVIPVRCQVVRRVDRPGRPLSSLVLLALVLGEELCLLLVRPICRCARPPCILHKTLQPCAVRVSHLHGFELCVMAG